MNSDGLITQSVREIGTFTYGYSLNNEVTSIAYSGSETLNNDYVNTSLTQDTSGNLTAFRGETFYNFNNFNYRIGSAYYWPDYSGLGRMVGEKRGTDAKALSYYPDGKLKEFALYSSGTLSRKVNYYYDGLGRRISKLKDFASESDSKVTYTHLGLEDRILLSTVTKDSTTVEGLYIDGQGIDDHLFEINSTNGAKAYVKDHLGSVINSSAIGGKSVFGLCGENLGSAAAVNSATEPVVYGFTGREADSEIPGVYHYRARAYDSYSCRFLTKDPLGPREGGDINPYRYVHNDPVNRTDPMGLRDGAQEDWAAPNQDFVTQLLIDSYVKQAAGNVSEAARQIMFDRQAGNLTGLAAASADHYLDARSGVSDGGPVVALTYSAFLIPGYAVGKSFDQAAGTGRESFTCEPGLGHPSERRGEAIHGASPTPVALSRPEIQSAALRQWI